MAHQHKPTLTSRSPKVKPVFGMTIAGDTGRIPPLLIPAREAARLLSISERTLRDRTKDGTLPVLRLNGRVLYSLAALTAWVEARLRPAAGD